MTREQKLALIYRHTHRDFKAVYSKTRYILVNRDDATEYVPLTGLTSFEVEDRLPYALMKKEQRLAAKARSDNARWADDFMAKAE